MSSTALLRPRTDIAQPKMAWGGPVAVGTSVGAVTLWVTSDLPSLKDLWEAMEATSPCTAAQTYGWAQAWNNHVLRPEGREPAIAVGYAADGTPLFLWPFETDTKFGHRILRWLSQDHANYNMGLFTRVAAEGLTGKDVSRLLREAARQVGAAAAALTAQPFAWDGLANPFATLPRQASPNRGYAVKLGDFTVLYESHFSKRSRNTMDRKERRLEALGKIEYGWAETPEEIDSLLETIFAQKTEQFAAMGVRSIFDIHTRAFYRAIALLTNDTPSRMRLGYLALNGEVLATFSGNVCHDRMIVALSSLAEGDAQGQSPGALLLRHQIAEASSTGLAYYDLGVGQARHKDEWTNTVIELFDSFIAFKLQGRLVTLPSAVVVGLKRVIKSNRRLWSFAQQTRKRLFGG